MLGIPLQITPALGGTPFAGVLPEVLNRVPEQLAAAITPHWSAGRPNTQLLPEFVGAPRTEVAMRQRSPRPRSDR